MGPHVGIGSNPSAHPLSANSATMSSFLTSSLRLAGYSWRESKEGGGGGEAKCIEVAVNVGFF